MISGTNFRFSQVAFSNCEVWFNWLNTFVGRMKIFLYQDGKIVKPSYNYENTKSEDLSDWGSKIMKSYFVKLV